MFSKYDVGLPSQGTIRPMRQDLRSFHPTSSNFSTRPGSTLNYLGIPFAQPPIESLRWKPPNGPAPQWKGIRESKLGPAPLQAQGALPIRDREVENNEDCLYINIYKPMGMKDGEEKKLPVMVWGELNGQAEVDRPFTSEVVPSSDNRPRPLLSSLFRSSFSTVYGGGQ